MTVFAPKLLSARDEISGVRTFRFSSPSGFQFIPGQFVMFHFGDDTKTFRAYSVSSSPTDAAAFFEVTVAMVGDFSLRLGALIPGREQDLFVRGPFGKWVYDGRDAHAVLVAGGTGLTPMRAMCSLKCAGLSTGKITVCYSAKTEADFLFREEYAKWTSSGIKVHSRATSILGRSKASDVVRLAGDAAAVYYVCGPNKMVAEFREGLRAAGVADDKVRTEKWGDYTDLF